ncbi:MAG TPA: hypothetical protein VIC34_16170 [Croceibacterium sp.]|jgi:hypothetical protein
MDTLRGNFDALEDSHDHLSGEDESGREAPPASIGQDERRMQVRAYNHWASLLEERNFPSIDGLEPTQLPDFGPYSVLLDFTAGIENPGVAYLGDKLAAECDIAIDELRTLADVPPRSLLSRITDHYMQILANQAPIGFEAEFVNQRGSTILYRGILLPFSTDDEAIDFIYGVINWKELADQHTSDELLLQVDQALEQKAESPPARVNDAPLTDWADGPGVAAANDIDDEPLELSVDDAAPLEFSLQDEALDEDDDAPVDFSEGLPAFSGRAEDYLDDEDDESEEEDGVDDGLPRPKFGSLMSIGGGRAVAPEVADDFDLPVYSADEEGEEPLAARLDDVEDDAAIEAHDDFEYADDAVMALDGFELETGAHEPVGGIALPTIDPAEMALGDWLAAAREMAAQARNSEDRTRNALYEAIGRAYDFSLAATENPEDFDDLMADSGLTIQDRAPMTPVVKLVFGADYDKTRLTEYAAALSHAHRLELPRGSLGDFLRGADGGLKGVVKAERRLRRETSGKSDPAADSRELLAEKLREMPAIELAEIPAYGSEFALVVIRRSDSGEVAILGEVPEDVGLIEKAAKKLVG